MTTQGECGEEKKETNSAQEEHDVSNRQMTWWRGAWQRPTLTDGARPSKTRGEQPREPREARETEQEAKGEKWGQKERENQTRLCSENTLHIVLHLSQNATAAAPTTAAATAATRTADGRTGAPQLPIALGKLSCASSTVRH